MRYAGARIPAGLRSPQYRFLLPAFALVFLLLGATSALGITRATVLARAQVWVDRQVPYSQTHYFGGYRTDCSGFTSMTWQLSSHGHATSLSTRTLHSVSSTISPDALLPGDAMIKHGYHARIFYGWVDATHTSYIAYEETGPTTKSSVKSLAYDLAYGYVPYRYDHITAGPPAWNAVANPTFDVWAAGAPVWWQVRGGSASVVCTKSVDVVKSGHNALGLINPYARPRDIVEISQVAGVTPGTPYRLSVWARSGADPAGLVLQLRFTDGSGRTLSTTSTTGVPSGVGATALRQMSVSATAPADATSATVSVGLAGGVDASGTVGTTAVLDDFRLYDASPVVSAISVSKPSTTRRHAVTVSGTFSVPITYGSVRVYVQRPDRRTAAALKDVALGSNGWSLAFGPGLRGTYKFTAKYLGYGPWGPVTSASVSLRVK
jgi:hypothetical protein